MGVAMHDPAAQRIQDRALALARRAVDRVAARVAHGAPLFAEQPAEPPGPPGSLVLGHLAELWRDPLALFSRCMTGYGPLVRLRVGLESYYVLNHPDLVQHVFVSNSKNYVRSQRDEDYKLVLGNSLLTSEGEEWRRQRKLTQGAFHRERIAAFADAMIGPTRDLLTQLKECAGKPVLFSDHLNGIALRIVSRTFLLEEVGEHTAAIRQAANVANEFTSSLHLVPTWVPTRRHRELKQALAVFDALIFRMIAARRASGAPKQDLLSLLMAAQDDVTGERMSDRQIRDQVLTFLLGGHETTGSVLSWTFYLLSLHPEIEVRLRAHIQQVLGDRDPTAEDVPRLDYVAQVIQESMRLYPSAWVLERGVVAEDTLAGYRVPAGATVAVCPYTLHRHPDFWDDPEVFDPDRFAAPRVRERSRYVYLPFGTGPRVCIGNTFAMMEMAIIVAMVVREYRLELWPGQKIELEPLVSLRPKGGLRMVPRPISTSRPE